MDGPDQVSPEAYIQRMRERMAAAALRRVAEAVNAAPDGSWIDGSETEVFAEFNDLRREAYEAALQMRADAAASGFSPGGPGDGAAQGRQGAGAPQHADGVRAGERHRHPGPAGPVARPRPRGRRAGGPAAG